MKVLLLGADTETGAEMVAQCEANQIDCVPVDARKVDLGSTRRVMRLARRHQPDFLVNLIDHEPIADNESEANRAREINCDGVHTIAKVCASRDIPLLHLSTDAIFGNGGEGPFVETSDPAPTDAYGASHFQGEQRIVQETHRYVILRSGWVFGSRENNFLAPLLDALRTSQQLALESGRQFAPTAASDVARVFIAIIKQLNCGANAWGVYHYCSADITSWYGFAEQVLASAGEIIELDANGVIPEQDGNSSVQLPKRAVAQISCRKILYTFGIKQRHWDAELQRIVKACLDRGDTKPVAGRAAAESNTSD